MDLKIFSKMTLTGFAVWTATFVVWIAALTFVPSDAAQGEVYRIIYLHVPAAISAFAASFLLALAGISALWTRKDRYLTWQRALAESGLLMTILALLTGSIWGKPTWGTWWTWDARLTTTFLLALLLAAYLMLHAALPSGRQRLAVCSGLSIFIFADVPIIYKSVTWWRTLHQPPTILRSGGSTMAPEMLTLLLVGIAAMIAMTIWMAWLRTSSLQLSEELENQTGAAFE
jgi:heme exporter protein C